MISILRLNCIAVAITLACLFFVDNLSAEENLAGRLFVAPGANINSSDDERIAEGDLEYNFALGYYLAERWAMEMRAFGGSYDVDEANFDYLGATVGLTYMPFRNRQWGKSFSYVLPPFLANLGKPFVRLAAGQIKTDTLVDKETNNITEASLGLDILPKNKIWYLRGEFILRQEDTDTNEFNDQLINVSWVLPFGKIYRLNVTSYDPEEGRSNNTANQVATSHSPTQSQPSRRDSPPKVEQNEPGQTSHKDAQSNYIPPAHEAITRNPKAPTYTPPVPQAVQPNRTSKPTHTPPPVTNGATPTEELTYSPPKTAAPQPIRKKRITENSENKDATYFELDPNNPNLLARLTFKYRTSDLTEDSIAALEQIIVLLTENPELKIKLIGYTDNRGDLLYNLKISEKRAQSARDYLIYKGVPTHRIVAVEGKGPANPIANNNFASGRAKNRRVEVERM